MTTLYTLTAFVLIVLPIAFNGVFFALGRSFDYPDILRKPTDEILRRFSAGGGRLIALWYAFAFTALLAVPMAILVGEIFAGNPLAGASVLLGSISGLVQAMGLFRWPLLVPYLAAQYNAPETTAAGRETIGVVFGAMHQYVGVVVGEHLGYLFTASWTILVSVMMANSPIFGGWLAAFGIVSAVGILTGLAEPFGWKPAGMLNAISYLAWSAWLLVAGLMLLGAA